MTRPPLLDELGARLRNLAEQTPLADLDRNARAVLASTLSRLDLVTREEFDAQARVLAHTREKLEALEARVQALEEARPAESGPDAD